ncbi:MAG: hypothetical protein WA151_22115 [Desulfatirhabdiaceae bacterium]
MNPFGIGTVDSGPGPGGLLYLVWVGFWTVFIVGTANYYNFMDGINGIAGITGLLGFAFLAGYVNLIGGPAAVTGVAVCLSMACLGFLPLNMPNARVFMGDIEMLCGGHALTFSRLTDDIFDVGRFGWQDDESSVRA